MQQLDFDRLSLRLRKRFDIVRKLGSGAAASVFLAVDREYGDYQVALKVLNAEADFDVGAVQRFCDEYQALCKIQHPNLVEAYALVEHGDILAYTMEYVPGKTLLEASTKGRLASEETTLIVAQILAALSVLHEQGIMHRDIKLENVLVRDDGMVKLSDLGLQKSHGATSKTRTGVLLGTTHYMPPEYIRYGIYDVQSDLYAVGLLLYECLIGKRWLESKDSTAVLKYVSEQDFIFPKLALSGLPSKFVRILEQALDPEPRFRFSSAAAMRRALLSENGTADDETVVQVQDTGAFSRDFFVQQDMEHTSYRRRRSRVAYASFAGSIAAAATLTIATIGAPKPQTPPSVRRDVSAEAWEGFVERKKVKGRGATRERVVLRGDGHVYRIVEGFSEAGMAKCRGNTRLRLDTYNPCEGGGALSLRKTADEQMKITFAKDGRESETFLSPIPERDTDRTKRS